MFIYGTGADFGRTITLWLDNLASPDELQRDLHHLEAWVRGSTAINEVIRIEARSPNRLLKLRVLDSGIKEGRSVMTGVGTHRGRKSIYRFNGSKKPTTWKARAGTPPS